METVQSGLARDRYARAFSPFRLGNLTLKNRIFVPAHTTNFAEDFLPGDKHVAYHRERAKGGAGLIIVEPLRAHRTSLGRSGGLTANDRRAVPGLRRITDAIHAENIPVFVQITHAGRHGENFVDRTPAWGPSSIPWTTSGDMPHAMTRREIREVIAAYQEGAELAIEAGFDGMEIHFGHGHLLHQFLSPASNDRDDEYGGSFENRLRFPLEVLRAVVDTVAGRVPFGIRLSVDELLAGGLDVDASREIAHRAAIEPGVSFINASVSSYSWPSIGYHVADMSYPPHPYLEQTVALRDAIGGLAMLTANRYTSVADAEEALATGAIDLVGMVRAHIADPDLVNKTLAGREKDIRPCVASNYCIEQLAVHRPITCSMNPRVGREAAWPEQLDAATGRKRVLVVGGGPAGLEAARVASSRGHDVTLWERDNALGGALRIGGTGIGRQDLHQMKAYLERGAAEAGVKVELGREGNAETIAAFGADAVVLASGARDESRSLPGWDDVLSERQALAMDRGSWAGMAVFIYDRAGSWATLSVAETLAASGARVTLAGRPETVLWGVTLYSRMTALDRLRERGVQVLTRVEPIRAWDRMITLSEASLGRETPVGPFDKLVVSTRGRSDLPLADALERLGATVHCIGDASAPAALLQAIFDGHAIGRRL